MGATPPGAGDNGSGKADGGALAHVSARTVALGALVVVGVALAFLFVARFYMVLFVLLVAIIIATVTRPAVDWLARRGIRQEFAVILVYLGLFAVVALFGWVVGPLVVGQISGAMGRLPELYADLRESLLHANTRLVQRLAAGLPASFSMPRPQPPSGEPSLADFAPAWQIASQVGQGAFSIIAILALGFYWTAEGELLVRRALLFVSADRREQVRVVWAEMEGKVAAFFRGQLILMGIVAAMTFVGYLVTGMPYALALALIAGVCEAIPIIGPTIAVIPAILVAASAAPDKIVFALGVGALVQVLENNLLVPRIMDQSVGVNPIVTILAIAGFGALFGVAGALLAIPLAAMVQIVVRRLLFERVVPGGGAVGRSRASILRLATKELAEDARRTSRSEAETDVNVVDPDVERAEDMLESIAMRLDEILSTRETTP